MRIVGYDLPHPRFRDPWVVGLFLVNRRNRIEFDSQSDLDAASVGIVENAAKEIHAFAEDLSVIETLVVQSYVRAEVIIIKQVGRAKAIRIGIHAARTAP